mmetsp:Transcript_32869/g.84884  ORF Transcript_32869/g.84884 Transcript_32869/m.84884 type:complete len:206 (-) Transcript_32869:9-626(-)
MLPLILHSCETRANFEQTPCTRECDERHNNVMFAVFVKSLGQFDFLGQILLSLVKDKAIPPHCLIRSNFVDGIDVCDNILDFLAPLVGDDNGRCPFVHHRVSSLPYTCLSTCFNRTSYPHVVLKEVLLVFKRSSFLVINASISSNQFHEKFKILLGDGRCCLVAAAGTTVLILHSIHVLSGEVIGHACNSWHQNGKEKHDWRLKN